MDGGMLFIGDRRNSSAAPERSSHAQTFAPGLLQLGRNLRIFIPGPVQIRHLVTGRRELRDPVAIQTERHAQRLRVVDLVHLVDLARGIARN
jgi:hypothetical protein